MLTTTWQMDLFIYQTVILIPIYMFILMDFVVSRRKHRVFRNPYYTFMISQGLADIATISVFSSLVLARYFSFGNLFLYSLRPFMPIFYANSGPMLFTTRIVGVFLITVQRYLTVCRPHGTVNFHLNNCPPILLILLHWFIGTIIYLPALLHSDATFENEISLFIMTSKMHAQVFSVTVATSFFTIGFAIIVMYSRIAVVMIKARQLAKRGRRRSLKSSYRGQEARLTFHVFILVLFCIICFVFYLGEFYLSFDEDRTRLKAFRLYYPTVSGNFSFINPIMLLTLNRDVQRRLRKIFCRKCFVSHFFKKTFVVKNRVAPPRELQNPYITQTAREKISCDMSSSEFSDGSEVNFSTITDSNKTGMLTPTWQMDFFIIETVILIPLYMFILLGILVCRNRHKTFQSPVYTLMVSQGLADICTVLIFSSLIAARYFSFGNVTIYSLSPYSAYAYTNSGPFMFTLRGVGVFLITTQRYLTVCKSHGVLNYRLNHCPPLLLGFAHWLLALLIYLPALLNTDTRFENEITLLTIASRTHLQYTSITVMTTYLVACVAVLIMYYHIARVMIQARKVDHGLSITVKNSSKKLKDARLTLHVFILVLFCFIAFFFYIGEYVLAFDADVTRVRAFRLYYPTVSGNLSFINPIMLLMLNKDVQSAFCCRLKRKPTTLSLIARNGGKSTTG